MIDVRLLARVLFEPNVTNIGIGIDYGKLKNYF